MESIKGSVPLRSAASEAILRQIRADIITRKLKRGQKLTEQSVCQKYGISRSDGAIEALVDANYEEEQKSYGSDKDFKKALEDNNVR